MTTPKCYSYNQPTVELDFKGFPIVGATGKNI